jgi:hypothetical protein
MTSDETTEPDSRELEAVLFAMDVEEAALRKRLDHVYKARDAIVALIESTPPDSQGS